MNIAAWQFVHVCGPYSLTCRSRLQDFLLSAVATATVSRSFLQTDLNMYFNPGYYNPRARQNAQYYQYNQNYASVLPYGQGRRGGYSYQPAPQRYPAYMYNNYNNRYVNQQRAQDNYGNEDFAGDTEECDEIRNEILNQLNVKPSTSSTADAPQSYVNARGRKRPQREIMAGTPKRAKLNQNDFVLDPNRPLPDPSGGDPRNAQISKYIWDYFLQNHQTQGDYRNKVQLRDALYHVFKDVFPLCGLYIVGSSMTGFSTRKSDMDICLMVSHSEINQKKEAAELLYVIQKALRCCSFFQRSLVIRAKVPILKFFDAKSQFEVDLNINNSVGIRNTHLLKYYCNCDWRVRPLVLITKYWARFHDINDASKMTISSYTLCLMVIHYLQNACKPPVLPCLQKIHHQLFDRDTDIRYLRMNVQINHSTENTQSLGDLFLGFLEYYTFKFDFENDVASVRLGTRVPFHMILRTSSADTAKQWKCLKVEEPFDLSNTARSCYDNFTFMRVQRVFHKSATILARKRSIESILNVPF